jgi:hypothetical protein
MKTQRFKRSRIISPSNAVTDAPPAASYHHHGFIQKRLQNFGLSMVVMGASFTLYYLGFFGGVSGPLAPERIGDKLAALGFSNRHLLFIFLLLTAIAISWNWLYNAMNRMLGRHFICTYREDGRSFSCNKPIRKRKFDQGTGLYICRDGHTCSEIRTNIVRKGTLSHFFWMMWLIFSGIVFYFS